ncbi:MAG: methyltransferase domain-containing protein [bacterium]
MKADGKFISQRIFAPEGHYPYAVWFTKKVINKAGSLGKRHWYHLWKTYPWEPQKLGFTCHNKSEQMAVRERMESLTGTKCPSVVIERNEFDEFLKRYEEFMGQDGIRHDPCYKKIVEYFLTLKLIGFKETDTYIDVGSWLSPFPDLIREQVRKVYCQDLTYRPGFYQDQIGCNAAHIPLPDKSIDKMTLHCTFEHFEKENDTLFIMEAQRLLKPGGRCFIVPLYLSRDFTNLTDPSMFSLDQVGFDHEATICRRFGFLNRFGRIYSPEELVKRIISVIKDMRVTIYWIEEVSWLPITRSLSFALMLENE